MPKRVAISNLNASTIDILNTIRQNAGYEYQQNVPVVAKATDIPKVGEVLYGYPALANQFLNALVNRIAAVRVRSATFNNAFKELKKGYLEFGETVEECFVEICRAREFSAEKGEARELKRSIPDVRSAFHSINWRVQYPITIQDDDLKRAFLSIDGVQDLIARIVDSVYTAAEYDEYLLFKYLIIKAYNKGAIKRQQVDSNDLKDAAVAFRGASAKFGFVSTAYNSAGVHTSTPVADQYIFMDADFNAEFGVDVLSAAFNMDKADYIGKLKLIDDWASFDNDRFAEITANSDMIEPVTEAELENMKVVVGVLADKEFFQIYDNLDKFTEKYVASGLYWNYFYNVWKIVSYSPFSNIVAFCKEENADPDEITVEITAKDDGEGSTLFTLSKAESSTGGYVPDIEFHGNEGSVTNGVAIHPYGAYILMGGATNNGCDVLAKTTKGTEYVAALKVGEDPDAAYSKYLLKSTAKVGDTLTLYKASIVNG